MPLSLPRFALLCALVPVAVPVGPAGRDPSSPRDTGPARRPLERRWDQTPPADPVAEGQAVIEHAAETYHRLRTYSDRAIIRRESESTGSPPDIQAHETELEFRFAPPNLFVLTGTGGGAYCDGVRLWLHDAAAGVYSESSAPAVISLDDLDRRVPAAHLASHPIARAMLGGTPGPRAWGIDRITGWMDESRHAEPGHRVRAVGRGDIADHSGCPGSLWVNDGSGLVEEIVVDLTRAFRAANPGLGTGGACGATDLCRVTVTTRLMRVRVDEPIPAGAFAFHPRPADRRVEEIPSPLERARDSQASMVGRDAPPFERMTLDGERFSLADAAGRVVLLYFWDTGCVASVNGLSGTCAIADRFREAPITVLGVNQDRPAAVDCVRRVIVNEGACATHVMDGEGELARAYALAGIPCSVLIDQRGMIRAIEPGPPLDPIASAVRALLQGQPVGNP